MYDPDVHFVIRLYQKHTEKTRIILMFHFVCLESHRIKTYISRIIQGWKLQLWTRVWFSYRWPYFNPFKKKIDLVGSCSCQWWCVFLFYWEGINGYTQRSGESCTQQWSTIPPTKRMESQTDVSLKQGISGQDNPQELGFVAKISSILWTWTRPEQL